MKTVARYKVALATILLTVAVIAAIVVGVFWWNWHVDHSRAAARDAAVDGARQAIVDTQTFNTSNIPGTLDRIGSAMTGDLREQWDDSDRKFTEDQLNARRDAGFRTEPVVVAAAPTEFDASSNTAKVLVYLVQKFYIGGKQTADTYRWTYLMGMSEADGHWKASSMTPLQEGGQLGSSDPSSPATATAPTSEATPSAAAPPESGAASTGTPITTEGVAPPSDPVAPASQPAPTEPAAPSTTAPAAPVPTEGAAP